MFNRVYPNLVRLIICCVVLSTMGFIAKAFAADALSDADKEKVCFELTTLYRSARGVISANQALINDASKGNKGLTGAAVVEAAKVNFKKATGKDLASSDGATDDSLAERSREVLIASITEVMDENQDWINEEGKGFKGFLPAVFAKMVADRFSEKMSGTMFIKLTAPKEYVRNRANRPDTWEHNVIEDHFKSAKYENGKPYFENSSIKERDAFRLMIPEYYKESCLKCHGGPKGSRDITGGKKEGGELGELGGAISVGIFN